ncbi:hypothetical protein GW17_00031702 [Ensete ventricosum]|nr:hypothetical protein GW17_00031702 [Ensete ventricosum]RZR90820.1 hypothetical protein BHM03_00018805 [Ensete ventricosum]
MSNIERKQSTRCVRFARAQSPDLDPPQRWKIIKPHGDDLKVTLAYLLPLATAVLFLFRCRRSRWSLELASSSLPFRSSEASTFHNFPLACSFVNRRINACIACVVTATVVISLSNRGMAKLMRWTIQWQGSHVQVEFGDATTVPDPLDAESIKRSFPLTYGQPLVHFVSSLEKPPPNGVQDQQPPLR